MDKQQTEIEQEIVSWMSTITPAQAAEMLPRAEEGLIAMRAEYYRALVKVKCLRRIIKEVTE